MKRKDMETGKPYAYARNRDPWGYKAYVLLSTTPHRDQRQKKGLRAEPGATLGMGQGYWSSAVGLPAVELNEDREGGFDPAEAAAKVMKLATVEDYAGGKPVLDEDGTGLGTYHLVTSYSYLRGDYAEEMAKLQAQKDARAAARQAAEHQRRARVEATNAVLAQIKAMGITALPDGAEHIRLRTEEAAKMVEIARRTVG